MSFRRVLFPIKKPQITISGGGGGVGDQLPTFDAESKSANIPKSLLGGFQLSKSQLQTFKHKSRAEISIYGKGGGQLATDFQKSTSNFQT